MDREDEVGARLAAIRFAQEHGRLYEDLIPRSVLEEGFVYRGVRIRLQGPQGIWWPAGFELPLSITTIPVEQGRDRPYEDSWTTAGMLIYRYRGTDPAHRDNIGLRKAMAGSVPLIYLHGVAKARYTAACPVFVVGDEPQNLYFKVAVDDPPVTVPAEVADADSRRRYVTRLVLQRVHQAEFRARVLAAYRQMCAMCRLRHDELLDAAHILPDGHPRGEPVVSNGLALCKLHHAAFDSNMVGVREDRIVVVRPDLMRESDGPMLRYGLQGLAGQRILTPKNVALQPNPEFLAERFRLFEEAS